MPNRAAGRLKQRVAFEQRVTQSDGYGNKRGAFAEIFRCSAGFETESGRETVLGARLEGRQTMSVRVRSYPNTLLVTSDWRMRDLRTDVSYAIVAPPAETSDRQFIDLTVERGVAE